MQVGQRARVVATGLDAAIDQVAGDHDQVRLQRIALLHHPAHPGTGQQAAGMDVGQLQHAVAVEGGRQILDRHVDLPGLGHHHALADTIATDQQRQHSGHGTQPGGAQCRYRARQAEQARQQQSCVQHQHHQRQQQHRRRAGGQPARPQPPAAATAR
ncbi:hypothetical protein G6F63_013763 [Rhizopus arrhizus]|nr:hypothetical protein G6F63_013763 [Rhizopus arrhizus]